jgi:hypothetical protein
VEHEKKTFFSYPETTRSGGVGQGRASFSAFIGAKRRALTDDGAEGTPRDRPTHPFGLRPLLSTSSPGETSGCFTETSKPVFLLAA